MSREWFTVDKEGLGKLLERRGKEFAVAELISNSWDQSSKNVNVTLVKNTGTRYAILTVEDDDPDGFADLSHAWTLFAESTKKDKADKRGRFNMGEKLVLALCEEAKIISTKGGVVFSRTDGRKSVKDRREAGSIFVGTIKMNAQEFEEVTAFVRTLIPPAGIRTVFNGEELQQRRPLATFEMPLDTHISDAEGVLKRSVRKAQVRVYEPLADEIPSLYEMGIPVVETNDKWHIDVQQKLPLSMERENVPPAFLRKLRAEVMNQLFSQVKGEDASATWVKAATEAPEASPQAVKHYLTETFGPKHVIFDPSDQEANKIAVSQGYGVIYPRSLSSGQWDHVKENFLALPAGQVTPSAKVNIEMAIGGTDGSTFLPEEKWSADLKNVAAFSKVIANRLLGVDITVQFTTNVSANYAACYGSRKLIYSVGRLGYAWFKQIGSAQFDLLIHELGHELSGDHLSKDFNDALTKLGGQLTYLALTQPDLFANFGCTTAAQLQEV